MIDISQEPYCHGSYGSKHGCNINCFHVTTCRSKTTGLKIHMESAISNKTEVLCGMPRTEDSILVSNPSGKPTCKRCLKIIGGEV